MKTPVEALVCFAVREELAHYKPSPQVATIVTGMGRVAAQKGLIEALTTLDPQRVITAGFAGALDPELKLGTIVFNDDAPAEARSRLLAQGARAVSFHCSERVLVSAAEKAAAFRGSGCTAVEMESAAIHQICRERKIACVTLRVISDVANENLPMDFNRFAKADGKPNLPKLVAHVMTHPRLIPRLIQFNRQIGLASRALARAIGQFVERPTEVAKVG